MIQEIVSTVGQDSDLMLKIRATGHAWIRVGILRPDAFMAFRSWLQILVHRVGELYPAIDDRAVRPLAIMAIVVQAMGSVPGDGEVLLRDTIDREIAEWRIRRGFGALKTYQPGALGQPLVGPEQER